QPVRRRAGEVHRLRAVRVGVPRRRDLRRGRPQRGPARERGPRGQGRRLGRGAHEPRRAVRPRLPYQLPAGHLLRAVHRGVPHPMVEGTTDTDYYSGDVLGPTTAQVDWVREHRPEDETLEAAQAAASGQAPAPTPRKHELRPDEGPGAAQRSAGAAAVGSVRQEGSTTGARATSEPGSTSEAQLTGAPARTEVTA